MSVSSSSSIAVIITPMLGLVWLLFVVVATDEEPIEGILLFETRGGLMVLEDRATMEPRRLLVI